ncbi:MAG: hypothetical protein ACLP19_14860 [Xanthobacteraceae bacterium]
MPEPTELRKQHFEANCLAWTALNHFLSADLLREFSQVLIEAVGGGLFKLDQLFEDELIAVVGGLESWAVRPLDVESPVAQYLQSRIRYLVWANDTDLFYDQNQPQPAGRISPAAVEDAIRLGQCDLNGLEQVAGRLKVPPDGSYETLVFAMRKMGELREPHNKYELPAKIVELCNTIDMPLAAVVTKHLGDLCVDADEWEMALQFYQVSSHRLERDAVDDWSNYVALLKHITTQSIASAMRAARGPAHAAAYLAPRLKGAALSQSLLFVLNASLDAYVAESLSSESLRFPPDRRASILNEPLLLQARNLSSAFEATNEREYPSARGHFWSVLRRQIALGSANDTRITQAHYANSVFSSLERTIAREINKELFIMALRLLLQSGQTHLAEKMEWSDRLVRAYIDDDIVRQLFSQTNAVEASREERLGVAVELLRGWSLALPAERGELAGRMLSFIAKVAASHKSSLSSRHNVGGRSIEVLRQVAERRPEFRLGAAADVVPAILSKLGEREFWTGIAGSCKTAAEYLDVLQPQDARTILATVLNLLEKADPARAAWVIVQPAIDLLVTPAAQRLAKQDKDLDGRIISTILRFGLNQKTEYTHLLFYLCQFDLRSVYQEPMRAQLNEVVQEVRKQALTIHASNAMDNVRALLLASSAAGLDGVRDALKAITEALNTAFGDQRRIALAFPFAYETFIILAERQQQIAENISVRPEELQVWLHSLLEQIIAVWSQAVKTPGIFAAFAIPPRSTPDPVVVHNWAFGSIALAKSLGEKDRMLAALDAAAKEPTLRGPITLARAVRIGPGELESLKPATIQSDNAETFYSALGQRLVSLQYLDTALRDAVIDSLLKQCLRLGPNGLDAAVFLTAGEQRLELLRNAPEYADYVKRVANNRDLRLALMPFVANRARG